MTSTSDQGYPSAAAIAPPPGCPAHVPAAAGTQLYGPDAERDSNGLYERLRQQHGPVAPVLVPGGQPAWLVLGYNEIRAVTSQTSLFNSDPRNWRAVQDGQVGPDHPLAPLAFYQPMANFADGPEHERLRRAVRESLDLWDGRAVRRFVQRMANGLIDDFAAAGRADLVSQFAEQLPMLVMTQLIGMPEEEGPRLVEACRDLMKGSETAVASNDYVLRTLTALVARKRNQPASDVASWLLAHESKLSDREVVEHLRLIMVGGNETTSNLIADMLEVVLTDPQARAQLSGNQLALSAALEGVLWDSPPLRVIPARYALGDTTLGEQVIHAGDMVLLGLAAGNADPRIRPEGSSMQGNRAHLAFGSGPHACPGSDIGRSIADNGIDQLLVRLPDLWLADEHAPRTRVSTWTSSHLVKLDVTFSPVTPPVRAKERVAPVVEHIEVASDAEYGPEAEVQPRRRWWSPMARWWGGY